MWGLKAGLQGLLAMGAFYCLGGWLITVEAPGHPGHPPSTQLDAVVFKTVSICMLILYILLLHFYGKEVTDRFSAFYCEHFNYLPFIFDTRKRSSADHLVFPALF